MLERNDSLMFSFFERLVNPFDNGTCASQPATIFGFINKQAHGLKMHLLLVAIFSTCTAATEVYIFRFLGSLVDTMTVGSPETFLVDNRAVLVQVCLILLIGLPIAATGHTLLWHQALEGNLPLRILSRVHQYLLKQGVQFYQVEAAGKVANTLLQTATSTKMIVAKSVDTFTFAFVFFVSMGVMLSSIELVLLMPVAVWFIGYVLVICYFVPKLKVWSNKQAGARSEMVGQLVDTYTNIATVMLFSHSSIERDYANSHMAKYLHTIHGQMRFISNVQFLMWGLNISLIFSTIALSIILWGNGLISVGAIAAAVGVTFRVYTMSHWIMWEVAQLFNNIGTLQDGIKLLSKPLPASSAEGGEILKPDKYDISFKNVDFSYGGNGKAVRGLSLSIRVGEKIGIIGRSGSGKSTLTKLLLRFYDPEQGQITIGGKNIKTLNHESLLENIAVVAQDVELLDRSVRDNLTYGKNGVSEAEMISAAKAAGAHDFIVGLVDESGRRSYDARVGVRGAKLSGGQRQRISLARALIKDAPILIFDEATSALDSEVESRILSVTKARLEGKTVIMIAHRLSTLAGMDRLAVINEGELVELGSHEELKAKKGFYFEMLAMQSNKILDKEKQPAVAV